MFKTHSVFGLLASAILMAYSASAATYHVETSGSDDNNGSSGSPFATIAKALTTASDGDVIQVGAGTYVLSAALTINKAVSVFGAGPESTTIDCNTKVKVTVDNADALLAGVTVTRGNAGWSTGGNLFLTANGGTVSNCHLVACHNAAATYGGGLCAYGGLVTHCLIARNKFGDQRAAGAYVKDAILRNSVICCNTNTCSSFQAGGVWASGTAVVENCTIFGNVAKKDVSGLYVDSNKVRVRNTIVWDNTMTDGSVKNFGGQAESTCIFNSCFSEAQQAGNIATDPGLDADGRITASSPCLNAGDGSLAWLSGAKDLDGNPRVYGASVDIGAYEFVPNRKGVVTITGSPSQAGVVSPAYGEHDGWTEGQSATFTAPETISTATERARCIGYRIFDVDARAGTETEIAGSPFAGNSFQYVHGAGERKVVWLFGDNQSKVTVTAEGGTVSVPNDGWVATGEPITLTAVPDEGRTFWRWEGTGAAGSEVFKTGITFTVTGAMAVTARFGTQRVLQPGDSIADAVAAADEGDMILLATGDYPQSANLLVNREVFIESQTGNAADARITRNTSKSGFTLVTLNKAHARLSNLTISGGKWEANSAKAANLIITGDGGIVEGCRILDASVSGNWAASGGAIKVESEAGVLRRCLVKGNKSGNADGGAGLLMTSGLAVDCLFVGNDNTSDSAKGIVNISGGKLLNCTVTGNTSRNVAGVTATGGVVKNCIISGNTQTGAEDAQKAVYSGTAALFENSLADILINSSCLTGSPVFVNVAADNARLGIGSAAVDAGANDAQLEAEDFYGAARVQGSAVDIGCAEFNPTAASVILSVSKTSGAYPYEATFSLAVANVPGWTSCGWDFDGDGVIDETTSGLTVTHTFTGYLPAGAPAVTLFDQNGQALAVSQNAVTVKAFPAVVYVNASSAAETVPYDEPAKAAKTIAKAYAIADAGTKIVVASGTYAMTQLTVEKAVTICSQSGRPEDVVLTRSGNALRPFLINHSEATVAGMTMTGFSSNSNYDYGHGAYIDVKGGTVSNCVMRNCTSGNYGALAGGVYIVGPGLVTHCIISNCTASTHGNGGSAVYMTKGTVRNTLMVNNSYPSTDTGTANWGTIYMTGGTVENCTLAGNSSRASCAGIWSAGGTVRNCVIAGNTTSSATDSYRAWAGTAANFVKCVTDVDAINASCAKDTVPFVSVGTGNYRLSPGGVAVDFAETLGWMTGGTDLDGNARIRGDAPDAGCYEAASGVFSASVTALGPTEGFAPYSVDVQATPVFGSGNGYTLKWYDGAATEPFLVTNALTFTFTANEPGRHSLKLTIIDDETGTEFTTDSPLPLFAAPKTMYVAAKDETVTSVDPYATPETAAPNLATAYAAALSGTTIVMKRGVHEASDQLIMKKAVTVTGETVNPEDTRFHYRGSDNRLFYVDTDGVVIRNMAMDGKYRGNGNHPSKANHIYANAFCTVSNCVMRNGQCYNWGYYAAAIYLKDGLISHCVITNNYTDANAGGTAGTSKEDAKGIAVHMRGGRIENCLVAYNYCGGGTVASNNGGAIYLAGGEVVNCTVVSNTFPGCAGVYAEGGRVVNTIIANNVSTVTGGEASVWRGDVTCFDHCVSDSLAVDGRIVCGDLRFRDVANGDWRILKNSAAQDIGDSSAVNEAADLFGGQRVFGRYVDAGCHEISFGGFFLFIR